MNKKGFTLIELMAVITILAILSLIIIPIVDKNIKESKENMFNIQLDNIRMAGQNYFSDNPSLLPIKSNYAFVKLTKLIDKSYIGDDIKNPKTSKPFEEEIVVQVYNDSDNYEYSVCPFEEGCIDNDDIGDDLAGFVKVRDTNPGIICGDELEENYYGNNICHIRSVEDLVGFSYLVNNKFSFTNKTILVMYNLDIKNTNSYVDPNNIMFGDVNGDGIASSLMEELTDLNGIGYPSIGNSTNKFLGDLDGDGHIINNLYINQSSSNYVGLFGYNYGVIQDLTISNSVIKGKDYTGLVGHNYGTIKGVRHLDMNISGNNYVGGIVGYNSKTATGNIVSGKVNGNQYVALGVGYNSSATFEAIVEGDVVSTSNYVGGLAGYVTYGNIVGVFSDGSVTASSSSYSNKVIGSYNNTSPKLVTLDSVSLNVAGSDSSVQGTSLTSSHGYSINSESINNIAINDAVLDTFVGGDNNGDGYYYDYNSEGKLDVFDVRDGYINITMDGRGTSEDPYIINNYNDLKQASTNLKASYRLNNDIDMKDKNPIIMGGYSNKFTGVFDGNGYSISNIKLIGYDSVGLFGNNDGKIRGLKLNNIDVQGNLYVGIVSGYNTGNITGMIVSGNVNGYEYVGLSTGYSSGSSSKVEVVASGNVYGKNGSTGGLLGRSSYSYISGMFLSGSVTSNSSSYSNKSIGYYDNTNVSVAALDSIVYKYGNTISSTTSNSLNSTNGYTATSEQIENIVFWDTCVDTIVGGDNNNDGYYYDYNSDGEIDVFSLYRKPMNITMSGRGTSGDPYIITNYDELKQASANLSLHYRLGSDIDLSDENPIFMGGYSNTFTGVFDGNGYSISNTKLVGYNSVGFFGKNTGTVRGLKLSNINSSGHSYVGSLTGYNTGNLTGNIVSGSVSGYEYVAIGTGYNDRGTVDIVASGDVYTTYNGGIISGLTNYGKSGGIVLSGSVTCSSSYCGRSFGRQVYSGNSTNHTAVHESVTVNSNVRGTYDISGVDGYTTNSDGINNIALWDSSVDTVVGGDNNNDGYYFDYNSQGIMDIVSLHRNPIVITMSGSGTSEEPYIITNYDELKQASTNLGLHYRLGADIDLSDENPIFMGGYSNTFTGVFDGNGYSISNTKLVGFNSVGFFGKNTGTVRGLKLNNIDSSGYYYVGSLTGYNTGNLTGNIVNGSASGYEYVAIGTGYNDRGTIDIVASGDVYTTYHGGVVAGLTNYGKSGGIVLSGSVTCSLSYCGRSFGRQIVSSSANYTAVHESVTVNSNVRSTYDISGVDGYTTNSDGINNIALWDSSVDTVVGGDNNNDGYYFDYNSQGIMDIVSLHRNPIIITMSGSGTSEEPYIITNYDELKQASTNLGLHYRLGADIDLSNENPIFMGGYSNTFSGVFDGNGYSISNTKLVGFNSVGFFGRNTGTVKGIRLLNMDVSGYYYIGVINGYNEGTIYDSFGSGKASGYSNIGLASGYTNGSIHAIVSGDVNVSNSYGGGIIGYSNGTTVKGAFISGSVRCYSSCNRTFGRGVGGTITTIALDSILVNSSTVNSTSLTSYDGKGYSSSDLLTSTPYESIGFNFTVTDPNQKEYIWYFDNNNLLLRKN